MQISDDQLRMFGEHLASHGLDPARYSIRAIQYHPDYGPHPTVIYIDGPVLGKYGWDAEGAWLEEFRQHLAMGWYDPNS